MMKLNITNEFKKSGLTCKELVKLSGLSYRTIQQLCVGGTFCSCLSTINALCKALHCTPNDIIEGYDMYCDEEGK